MARKTLGSERVPLGIVSLLATSCLLSRTQSRPFIGIQGLPRLTKHEEHDWTDVDCVFCCLPHATTQEIISQLPEHLKVRSMARIDLQCL